jgi:DNA-binding HxlR family transcriptional regulator
MSGSREMTASTYLEVPATPSAEASCLGPEGSAAMVRNIVAMLDGRWKLDILFRLFERPVLRFAELQRSLSGVSHKVLIQQLRDLETDGLVLRTDHAEVPPHVDYRLTQGGQALRPVLVALRDFARSHSAIEPLPVSPAG